MVEGIAVALVPAVADKGRYKQQQGAARLVEVGYQVVDHMVAVAWCYHQLSLAVEVVCVMTLHPLQHQVRKAAGLQ